MNIDSLGPETVDDYYSRGLIHDCADLYRLRVEDINGQDGTREKSARKIIDGIQSSLNVPFERVVFAIGIRFVGETTAKLIARRFRSMEALSTATLAELTDTEGIGPAIAGSIVRFFKDEKNLDIIHRLAEAGVKMETGEEAQPQSDKLTGKTIVISGVFTRHSRDEYKALIERHGGKNSGSISSKTSFILAGDNMGPSKLEKAKTLNIPVMDEDEFLAMVGEV